MKGWKLKARGAGPWAPCEAAQQTARAVGDAWGAGGTPEPSPWWFPMCNPTSLSPTCLENPVPSRRSDGVKIPAPPRCCRAPRVSQRAGGARSCTAAEVPRQGERV